MAHQPVTGRNLLVSIIVDSNFTRHNHRITNVLDGSRHYEATPLEVEKAKIRRSSQSLHELQNST
jgi:hypothetical protein